MARTTVAQLEERVAALEEEIETLRAQVESQPAAQTVSYVRELTRPGPISKPIDFRMIGDDLAAQHSYYDELGDVWGPGVYL